MRRSDFTETKQVMVKQGIADAAGVEVPQVRIVSVEAAGGVRRLLQDAITLEIEILAPDSKAAASVAQKLTADTINAQMDQVRRIKREPDSLFYCDLVRLVQH